MENNIEQLINKVKALPPEKYELAGQTLDYIQNHPLDAERAETLAWQMLGMEAMKTVWDNEEDAIYDNLPVR